MTLNDLRPRAATSHVYEIEALKGPEEVVQRLRELGFCEGGRLEVLGRLPFGGPWLVRLGVTSFALRSEEARCAEVKVVA
ncbi:MAG: ferrous iron transport protein A [Bdellovibrionaceae bacterium]|nr:ferrous iron transport protein A [Pseudobdellovibrionaceae bacterium]MBX3034971.1 ferrous iron transport protein A [Pseudobdellovibrionaceae bacterium]